MNKNNGRRQSDRIALVLVIATVLAVFLATFLLLTIGLVPASALRPLADRLSDDGAVASFDVWYPQIASRARLAGLGLVLVAAVVVRWKAPVTREVSIFLRGVGDQTRAARMAIGRLASEDGTLILLALAAISVTGAVLRIWLMNLPVSTDEAQTVVAYASRPLPITLSAYQTTNNHILHSALLNILLRVFGVELTTLRLPALLAGITLIPLVYFLARALGDRWLGLLAAAYVAVDPRLVQYSAVARGYTIATLFLVLAALCFVYWKKVDRFGAGFIGTFAALCALSLWTIPSALYGVVTLYLWVLVLLWRDKSACRSLAITVKTGLLMSLFVVLCYLPVALLWGPQQLRARDIYYGYGLADSIRFSLTVFPRWLAHYWNPGAPLAWILFWGVTLVAGFGIGLRRRSDGLVLAALAVAVPLIMIPIQGFGPTLDRILRVFNYLTVILALPFAGSLLILAPARWSESARRGAVLGLAVCFVTLRIATADWAGMRQSHVYGASLSDSEPMISLLYEASGPDVRVQSPNRLVWPVRFNYLRDGQSQAPFERAIPSDFQGRIILIVHDELQSFDEARAVIEERFSLEGSVDSRRLGSFGNATVHELFVRF